MLRKHFEATIKTEKNDKKKLDIKIKEPQHLQKPEGVLYFNGYICFVDVFI